MRFKWTQEKIELLKQYYPSATWEELYAILGTNNKNIIKNTVKKYRIFRDKKYCKNIKKYTPEELLQRLEAAVLSLGRFPMLKEFEILGLPPEVNYRRYFGSIDRACALLNIDRPDYEKTITGNNVYRDTLGNTCYSLGEQMISNFLIQQGFVFQKEVFYSSVIDDPLCKTKRFDWKIGNKFIEYFGLMGYHDYEEGVRIKINLCAQYHIDLLPIFPKDVQNPTWQQLILNFLTN